MKQNRVLQSGQCETVKNVKLSENSDLGKPDPGHPIHQSGSGLRSQREDPLNKTVDDVTAWMYHILFNGDRREDKHILNAEAII